MPDPQIPAVEYVWGAYNAALRELRRLQGRAWAPRILSAKRRKALLEGLKEFPKRTLALACRNLVLSDWHRGQDGAKREYLDVEYALRKVEDYADLCTEGWEEFKTKLQAAVQSDNGLRKTSSSAIFKRKGE